MSSNLIPSRSSSDSDYGLTSPSQPQSWQGTEPESQGVPIARYLSAIFRYKWLILGVLILGTAAGTFGTRFLKTEYQASASVWLGSGTKTAAAGPVASDPVEARPNWIELLTSRGVASNIVTRQRLFITPEDVGHKPLFADFVIGEDFMAGRYELRLDSGKATYKLLRNESKDEQSALALVESGAIGDSIGRKAGFLWQPNPALLATSGDVRFRVVQPKAAVAELQGSLNVRPVARTSSLEFTFTSSDPRRAASTLNAIVAEFIELASEIQTRNVVDVGYRLKEQFDSAAIALRSAESALETFRVNTITLPSDATVLAPGVSATSPSVLLDFYAKRQQSDALRGDRVALERILSEMRRGAFSVTAFSPIQSVNSSTELTQAIRDLSSKEANLRAARVTFTDSARVVQTLLRDVQTLRGQQLPKLTADLIADLRQREGDLTQQISRAATEIRGIPARTIEEQRLRRDVASKDALYQNIQTKYENVRLQLHSSDDAITVLDTAIVPQTPTTNRSAQIILMAFAASLALGIGGALALDLMDKRFRYPEQATGELGLPIVGAVPALVTLKSGASDPEEDSQVVEAFRTIRMNLIHAFDGAGSIVLTVSSPGPGDGKSLVSMNLAMRFAELGHHVLLVDGDIRRGELHETFEVARRPGLVDYLAGVVPLDSILRETSADNLTLIPCGSRRHRGPELLQSPVLGAFIEQMKTRYDVIIVDSPPLGVGVDPFVIGSATGNMLLVLRSGETDRKLALTRLRVLQRLPIRVVGAVLNGFSAEGAYRYYAHLYGYDMPEEDSAVPQLASKSADNGA